jgi:hypothetical protein
MQSLVENLQREGLTDSEKANAIGAAWKLEGNLDRSIFVKRPHKR